MDFPNSYSLKITSAKYFIPSGRLIQKQGYLPKEILSDTTSIDSNYYTKSGRTVSGLGGITPDYIVALTPMEPLFSLCLRKGLFFNFVNLLIKRVLLSLGSESLSFK